MSSFRARAMADRIVLIHDMPDRVVVSELDVEQADLLLRQMQIAIREALCQLTGSPPLSATVGIDPGTDGASP